MVKALACTFRWCKLLETGVHGTSEEISAAERISASYVSRILQLTRLAPDIVEAILDGREPVGTTLEVLVRPFPPRCRAQLCVHCIRAADAERLSLVAFPHSSPNRNGRSHEA